MLGVVALLAVTGVGGNHITSRTSFCGACHEMKTVHAGWTESVHAKTHCYACHADKGVVGAIKTGS
jgi:nitrate/TMAO reductase-like tetraheme cytochrome c subunit